MKAQRAHLPPHSQTLGDIMTIPCSACSGTQRWEIISRSLTILSSSLGMYSTYALQWFPYHCAGALQSSYYFRYNVIIYVASTIPSYANPSCLHTTPASLLPQLLSHTVLQDPEYLHISTRPSWDPLPPISLTSPVEHDWPAWRQTVGINWQNSQCHAWSWLIM